MLFRSLAREPVIDGARQRTVHRDHGAVQAHRDERAVEGRVEADQDRRAAVHLGRVEHQLAALHDRRARVAGLRVGVGDDAIAAADEEHTVRVHHGVVGVQRLELVVAPVGGLLRYASLAKSKASSSRITSA
jgi:hypothetical protein